MRKLEDIYDSQLFNFQGQKSSVDVFDKICNFYEKQKTGDKTKNEIFQSFKQLGLNEDEEM